MTNHCFKSFKNNGSDRLSLLNKYCIVIVMILFKNRKINSYLYTIQLQTDSMVDDDISYKNSQISSSHINILRLLTSRIIACI